MNSPRFIYVVAYGRISFIFKDEHYYFVCIYQVFIHSPVNGHLGSFHILTIVNNAAMNMECMYLFKIMITILLDIYPEMGLLDLMVLLFLIFWGTAILFSIAATSFFITITMCKGSNFSTSLSTFVIFCVFNHSHPKVCEVIYHCGFDLHFPND